MTPASANLTLLQMILAHWDQVAWVLGALSAAVAAFASYFSGYSLKQRLADRYSWPALITRYTTTGGAGYFSAIKSVLRGAKWLYGPRAISLETYGRCLTIAAFYPILAVLVGWVLFNIGTLGAFPLFDPVDGFWSRLLRALGLVASWIIAFAIAANAENFSNFLVDKLFGRVDTLTPRAGLSSQAARGVVGFAVFALAAAVAVAVAILTTLLRHSRLDAVERFKRLLSALLLLALERF